MEWWINREIDRMLTTTTTRLTVINTAWICLVVWAVALGHLQFVFTHDISHISYVIVCLLAAGLVAAYRDAATFLPRVEVWLVTLGLIGNVVGFIIALQHIDTGALGSAEGVQKVAAQLLAGMGVAFCSTLVGAVSALWVGMCAWVVGAEAG